MKKITKTLNIINKLGLHARAATQLVTLAQTFSSEITLSVAGKSAKANSVMALLMLAGANGSQVEVTCIGEDADSAMLAIEQLIDARFNESA